MVTKIRSHLTYANVMATFAVFVVLGGGAYAATKLPKNSVGAAQIKKNAVTGAKVKNGSLLGADFKAGQLPAGVAGAQGAKGDKGDPGVGLQGLKGDKGDKGDTGATGPSTGAAGGDLSGNYPNPAIASGAIGTGELARAISTYSDQMKDTTIAGDAGFHRVDFDPPPVAGGITTVTTAGASELSITEPGLYLVSGFGRWKGSTSGSYRQLVVERTGPSGNQKIMNDVD